MLLTVFFHSLMEMSVIVVLLFQQMNYLILLLFWLIYLLIAQTSEDVHKYIMALRECQLNELQPGQENPSVTALNEPYDENLHMSMQTFWDLFSSGMIKQTVTCQECNNVTTQNESLTELMLKFPTSHSTRQNMHS